MRNGEIVSIYDTEARRGSTNEHIYRRLVRPKYGISRATFYRILKQG